MHNVFARIIAALLWLEKRLEPIAKHPLGRVGLVLFFVMLGFSPAQTVYAAEGGPGVFETILLYIANIALSVAVVLSKLVIVIIQVLIPVMLYNNFSNSPVVTAGWAIVRDTVNMFFVIVLIAIAFGTIFGNEKFKWQQQMTKLMIFAIVINFSKTLCGLMIDLGQVIMLTFANAIREIAAGNFVQMLGMGDVYSLSTSSQIFQTAPTDSNATGPKAFDWFASSLASVFMMFIVLTTMLMLLAILMYRVVMLWILIVISPIAWFVGGAKGLINSGAYEQWWKKFICLVAIGPVLTFFLWLTLVVAGSGTNIDPGFITSGDASTAGGLLTKIFELDRLISFIIAIAMLYAGFDAANGVCGGAGLGFITDQMKGGPAGSGGARAARAIAGLGARVGAKGARVGASAARFGYNKGIAPLAGMAGNKLAGTNLVQGTPLKYTTSTGREGLYRNVAAKAGSGMVGKFVGRQALASAEQLSAERANKLNMSGLQYKGDSSESKNATLMRMSEKGAITPQGKLDEQALMMDAMKDPARMKELRASGTWDALWARHGKDLQTNAKGNKATKAIMDSYKKSNPDVTGSWEDVKDAKDAAGLSTFALASISKSTNSPLSMDSKFDKKGGGKMTVDQAIRERKMGTKEQQDALINGMGAIYEGMKPEELNRLPPKALAENMTESLMSKSVGVAGGPTVAEKMLTSGDASVQAAIHKKLNDPGTDPKVRDSLLAGAGIKNGVIEDNVQFMDAMLANPGSMSYLDPNILSNLSKAQLEDLGSGFADTKVLKSAVANYRKDPKSAAAQVTIDRIQAVLGQNTTPESDAAQKYLSAQKKAIDDGSRIGRIASGLSNIPGNLQEHARESINVSIENTAIDTAVGNVESLGKIERKKDAIENAVKNMNPSDPNYKALVAKGVELRKEFAEAKATIRLQVENIAGSDELSRRLDRQISAQEYEVRTVNTHPPGYVLTPEDNLKISDAEYELDQLEELKARVQDEKARVARAAARKTP